MSGITKKRTKHEQSIDFLESMCDILTYIMSEILTLTMKNVRIIHNYGVNRLKKIEAILRPQKLHDTIKALHNMGVTAFTVNQVVGRGQQKDSVGVYRGKNYKVTLHPKVKLEIVISDHMVEKTVQAIIATAQTGEAGDGKIFISSMEQAYNIRTGEIDETIDDLHVKEEVQ